MLVNHLLMQKNLKLSFLSETWVYFLLENVKTIKNPSN